MSNAIYNEAYLNRPSTTVDVVIYTIKDSKLHVLLIQRDEAPFKGKWSLVGGFIDVKVDHDIKSTALRTLKEKTGVKSPYLEQYGTVGNAKRDPRGWTISTIFFALLPFESIKLQAGVGVANLKWLPIENQAVSLKLAFDHNKLLSSCTERLQSKVQYSTLPIYLIKSPFTLRRLRETYETVLDTKIDAKTFRRRMLGADILEDTGDVELNQSKRPATLYKLKINKPYFFRVLIMGLVKCD